MWASRIVSVLIGSIATNVTVMVAATTRWPFIQQTAPIASSSAAAIAPPCTCPGGPIVFTPNHALA